MIATEGKPSTIEEFTFWTKQDLKLNPFDVVVVEHVQDCAWSRHGTIVLKNGCFPDMPGSIEVTLTDGWDLDEVPELQSLLLSIARRAMSQPAGIVASQSVNGSNVSYFHGSDGSTPGITLFASEKAALAPYRLTYGVRTG